MNLRAKDGNDEGDMVDPRFASALKIRRILDEIITKQNLVRSVGLDLGIQNLWRKASRIAWSDCTVIQTNSLRSVMNTPGRGQVDMIRNEMHNFVNNRGAQLRWSRLQRFRFDTHIGLIENLSSAFASIKSDAEHPLAALKRNDGTITGNMVEIDKILMDKWGSIFFKHNDSNPPPKAGPFFEKYNQFIDEYPKMLEPINESDVLKRVNKCNNSGVTGLDAWSPKDFKKLPDEILEYLCLSCDMVEKRRNVGQRTDACGGVSHSKKKEGCEPLSLGPISVLPIALRIWAAVRCKH